MLARRRAAESEHGVGDFLQHAGHALLPSRPLHLGQQVHVDMAVAGVAEDHGRDVPRGGHPPDDADVVAHAVDGNAGVLDHLERAPVLRQAREDRARRVAQLPQPRGALRGQRGVDRRGPGPHGVGPQRHRLAKGTGIVPLDLHQQDRLHLRHPLAELGMPHQVEEGLVEQLDRRRLHREQRRHHLHQVVEGPELDPESGAMRGLGVEPPLDRGHEAEGALRADDEIEQVARGEPVHQGVARGVLSRLGEPSGDDAVRGHDRRGYLGVEAADRFRALDAGASAAAQLQHLARPGHQLDRLHPAAHAAVAHRPGAGRVGGNHPAERGEAAARRVGGQPKPMLVRGGVELREGDVGTGDGGPVGGSDIEVERQTGRGPPSRHRPRCRPPSRCRLRGE